MRRVCILTSEFSPFSGGIGTYAIELARELVRDGVSVLVIAPEYGQSDEPHPFPIERLLGHHSFSPFQVLPVLSRLRSLEPETIIHPVDIRTVLLVYLARLLGGRRYRVTVHGSEVGKFRRSRGVKLLVKNAYLGAEVTLANSAATLEILRRPSADRNKGASRSSASRRIASANRKAVSSTASLCVSLMKAHPSSVR